MEGGGGDTTSASKVACKCVGASAEMILALFIF